MKTWHLWVGLALLVLLLLTVREGFAATATIKNPNTWDAAELTRIKAMGPPITPEPLQDADIRRVVGGFWPIWDGATSRITTAQVSSYLDTVSNLGANRGIFQTLIQKYYIDQGQSVFIAASGYSATDSGTDIPRPPSETGETTSTTIERPSTATDSLRREIATTFGVTLTDATAIDRIITLVQSFYDTVYVANDKATPTYTQMMSFADGVDTQTLPASVKNNFKPHMVEVLQTFFTPAGGAVVTPESGMGAAAGAADFSSSAGGAEGGQTFGTGKNVQGPESGGLGTGTENSTGGLGIPRNYPILYGGQQSYESAIPTSASLGTDPTSRFLPYSRVPGDMDLYPDPYRLGKYFSSSSYSSGKDAAEPAPFLADFSKFFT